MFESVWINIRVAACAVWDINGLDIRFLRRSFAHTVDPVLLTRNYKHAGCAVEKVHSHLELQIGLTVTGNGYLSSQYILLVARHSCDKVSGEPREARYERSSWRITLVKRDLSSQCIPCLVEARPYRWVIGAHLYPVPTNQRLGRLYDECIPETFVPSEIIGNTIQRRRVSHRCDTILTPPDEKCVTKSAKVCVDREYIAVRHCLGQKSRYIFPR